MPFNRNQSNFTFILFKSDPKEISLLKRQSTVQAIRRRRDTILEENRKMSSISSDQNDSTIGSNKRPMSLLVPKNSYELTNASNSLRGFPSNNSNRNSNNSEVRL